MAPFITHPETVRGYHDHYQYNPDAKGKRNEYLDIDGNPVFTMIPLICIHLKE